MFFTTVKSGHAPRLIKRILMRRGTSTAYLTVGKESRMLMHLSVSHEPVTRLPWPLSMMVMHDVEIVVSDSQGNKLKPNKRFAKGQINRAIEEFLAGSHPNDEVQINHRDS